MALIGTHMALASRMTVEELHDLLAMVAASGFSNDVTVEREVLPETRPPAKMPPDQRGLLDWLRGHIEADRKSLDQYLEEITPAGFSARYDDERDLVVFRKKEH